MSKEYKNNSLLGDIYQSIKARTRTRDSWPASALTMQTLMLGVRIKEETALINGRV